MELETTFYIMAIVFMSVMFILMVAALIAVFAIKRKIDAMQQNIEDKVYKFTSTIQAGSEFIRRAGRTFAGRS